jgi:hypothetical protein
MPAGYQAKYTPASFNLYLLLYAAYLCLVKKITGRSGKILFDFYNLLQAR